MFVATEDPFPGPKKLSKFMNFTEFLKRPLNFIISVFSSLILTEHIQTHFFTESVTETLNSDKSDSNHCYSQPESGSANCSNTTGKHLTLSSSLISGVFRKLI